LEKYRIRFNLVHTTTVFSAFPTFLILQILCKNGAAMSNVSFRIPKGSKGFFCVGALLVLITASAPLQTRAQAAQTPAAGAPDQYRAMLSTYCFTCQTRA